MAEIPLMVLSAHREPQIVVQTLKQGAVDYLYKPFVPEELVQRMKCHLGIQQKRKQLNFLLDETRLELGKKIEYQSLITEHLQKANQALLDTSQQLEEANTALKVLLEQRSVDQKTIQDTVQQNVDHLVLPSLYTLLELESDEMKKANLKIAISNLQEVVSPFGRNIQETMRKLSPNELKIAQLIGLGQSSKEIAAVMHLAVRTVDTHRTHIRKKLGLSNQQVNLYSYLQSLQST